MWSYSVVIFLYWKSDNFCPHTHLVLCMPLFPTIFCVAKAEKVWLRLGKKTVWFKMVVTIFLLCLINNNVPTKRIGGSRGRQGRAPPGGPNSFIFMRFSAKKLKNNSTFGNWRTPWGKSWIRHWNEQSLAKHTDRLTGYFSHYVRVKNTRQTHPPVNAFWLANTGPSHSTIFQNRTGKAMTM